MAPAEEQIQADIIDILNKMTEEWDFDSDEIRPDTKLVEELDFSSVDIMHLMASVDMRFERRLPFDQIILKEGQYVEDISVEELVNFVFNNFDEATPTPVAM
jgi:acyl carrier protein